MLLELRCYDVVISCVAIYLIIFLPEKSDMPHDTNGSVYAGLNGVVPNLTHIMPNGSNSQEGLSVNMASVMGSLPSEFREMEADKLFALSELVSNINLSRKELFSALSDVTRDLDKECHLPTGPQSASFYKDLYDGSSIAARVVEILPKECFKVTPEVTENEDGEDETEFEKAWKQLGMSLLPNSGFILDQSDPDSAMFEQEQGSPVWSYLLRADILSGIGQYGVIFFGIDDEQEFDQPAKGVIEQGSMPGERPTEKSGKDGRSRSKSTDRQYDGTYDDRKLYPQYTLNVSQNLTKFQKQKRQLKYLRVLPESQAEIASYETNKYSPRFGQPTSYRLTFNDSGRSAETANQPLGTYTVHWTRVQHIADWYHTADSSEVLAKPRIEPVLPEVISLRKPMYASAEGYYKMCMTILMGEFSTPDGTKPNVDLAGFKDMLWKLQNSMQRTGVLYNGKLNSIAPTVADPTPFVDLLVKAICRKLNIPVPVFDGYEIGEQASENNQVNWNKELANRQNIYITPGLIIPFITRLVMLGVLPRPKGLRIKWPDLDTMTKAQQGTLAQSRIAAMAQYTQSGMESWFPPHEILTREFGYDDDVAEAILAAGEEHALDLQDKQLEEQHRMIDEGLQPDPTAAPEPNPVQMKPGSSLVHPQTGKTIAKGPPAPPLKSPKVQPRKTKAVRNVESEERREYVSRSVTVDAESEPSEPVVNSTLGQFSQKLANWFWGVK